MSIRSVKKQIRTALADQKINKCEAEEIIATAQKGPLTTGEAKTIANTFERLDNPPMFSLPPPGVEVEWPTFDSMTPEARKSFSNFFVASRIPAGDNEANIRDMIKSSVKSQGLTSDKLLDCAPDAKHLHSVHMNDGIGLMNAALVDTAKQEFYIQTASRGADIGSDYYGPFKLEVQTPTDVGTAVTTSTIAKRLEYFDFSNKLDAQPANLSELMAFTVSDDRPVDGALMRGHLDNANDQYYVEYEISGRGGPSEPSFYGPFANDTVFKPTSFPPPQTDVNPRAITDETIASIKSSWAANADTATFRNGFNVPMGISFDRVEISNDADRGIADGFVTTALVPSGSQNPMAPAGSGPNPNEVSYYFVERSGGFAGLTQTAGPFDK